MPPALVLLLACTGRDPAAGDPPEPRTEPQARYTPLSTDDQRTRISMALRGVRPQIAEYEVTDQGALVDAWLSDPRFGATVRELYAEALRMRSVDLRLPQLGPFLRTPSQDLSRALSEEPLAVIERVVTDDLPFTTIVTGDWTILDRTASSIWRDHDFDADGPDVQVVHYTDGRPAAGILSTNALWARHVSMGSNNNRGRANAVADTLLCADFLGRDVPIDASVDLADDDAVAQAVSANPTCVSCHQSLDPLAAHFWVYQPIVDEGSVALAEVLGCPTGLGQLCYPIRMYTPELSGAWLLLRLRPPGLYGQPTDGLADLGQQIAADPRFAQCAARRFWSFLSQTPLDQVDFAITAELQQTFVDSGFSARALARAVVTHPAFLARDASLPADGPSIIPGPLMIRPEQLGRMIEDLTGFRFVQQVDDLVCTLTGLTCYGDVDLTQDDQHGMRAMAGGTDGARVLQPTHSPTPVQLLFAAAMAEEAAGWTVRQDFAVPAAQRRLLGLIEPDTVDDAAIRAQLAWLHRRVLGEVVAVDGPEIDADRSLFDEVRARGDGARAWRAMLAAMLQSPRVLYH